MSTHANKTENQKGKIELFELELTKTQLKTLSNLLPQGFSLDPVSKHKEIITSSPTKKLFTNDKSPVVKQNGNTPNNTRHEVIISKSALRDPQKRRVPVHFDEKFPEQETTPASKVFKLNNHTARKCSSLLQKLKKHPSAGPFLYPVNAKALGLIGYHDVVKEPMDLSTVENKLKFGKYLSVSEFAEDIHKIWNNSYLYNNIKESDIYAMTGEMKEYFEKLLRDIDNIHSDDAVRSLEKKIDMLSKQIKEFHQRETLDNLPIMEPLNRSRSKVSSRNSKIMEKPLTIQEKIQLSHDIKRLPPEYIRGVWEIVRQHLYGTGQEELEFDLERLPVNVTRELERYVKNKLSLVNRGKNKKAKAKEGLPSFKHEGSYYEPGTKGEDEITTQHYSGSEKDGINTKEDDLLSNSNESSFISDSDSEDGDDKGKNKFNGKNGESIKALQDQSNLLIF